MNKCMRSGELMNKCMRSGELMNKCIDERGALVNLWAERMDELMNDF